MDIGVIDSIVSTATFSNQHSTYDLSIFEYSLLLYRALLENPYLTKSQLIQYQKLRKSSKTNSKWEWQSLHKSYMDLCMEIAFYTTSTHAGLSQYQMSAFKMWIPVLNACIADVFNIEFTSNLSQIVFSFIFYDYSSHSSVPNIKWYEFDGDYGEEKVEIDHETCNEFENQNENEPSDSITIDASCFFQNYNIRDATMDAKCAAQLVFSVDGQTVDFSKAQRDWILLTSKNKINDNRRPIRFIHCYITGKRDEMWIGLRNQRLLQQPYYSGISKFPQSLVYYGGRTSRIYRFGGFKSDHCSGGGNKNCSDCNHGSMQGYGVVHGHPLDSYSAGDWISIYVDFSTDSQPLMIFYKNGIEIFRFKGEHKMFENVIDGELYLVVEVDTPFDGFYVEESVANPMFSFATKIENVQPKYFSKLRKKVPNIWKKVKNSSKLFQKPWSKSTTK